MGSIWWRMSEAKMEKCIGDSFSCLIQPSYSPRAALSLQILVRYFSMIAWQFFVVVGFFFGGWGEV